MAASLLTKAKAFRQTKVASRLATTLNVTGELIDTATSIFGAPPFVGLISGACKMGGKLLIPPSEELVDLEQQSKELQESLKTSTRTVQKAIKAELAKVQSSIEEDLTKHAH